MAKGQESSSERPVVKGMRGRIQVPAWVQGPCRLETSDQLPHCGWRRDEFCGDGSGDSRLVLTGRGLCQKGPAGSVSTGQGLWRLVKHRRVGPMQTVGKDSRSSPGPCRLETSGQWPGFVVTGRVLCRGVKVCFDPWSSSVAKSQIPNGRAREEMAGFRSSSSLGPCRAEA